LAKYLLIHRHDEPRCQAVYESWNGWDSPLLPSRPPEVCRRGGHTARWIVDADDAAGALALLPPALAEGADAIPIT
jgi:hypothetical protein